MATTAKPHMPPCGHSLNLGWRPDTILTALRTPKGHRCNILKIKHYRLSVD